MGKYYLNTKITLYCCFCGYDFLKCYILHKIHIMLLIEHIGQQIKERRDCLRITQLDLAEIAEISPNTLYKIEKGQANPSIKVLLKILNVLGLELEVKTKSIDS